MVLEGEESLTLSTLRAGTSGRVRFLHRYCFRGTHVSNSERRNKRRFCEAGDVVKDTRAETRQRERTDGWLDDTKIDDGSMGR